MLTSLGLDVDHSLLVVLAAVLCLLAPNCTVRRDGGAAWVGARHAVLAVRTHHTQLGVLTAVFRLFALQAVSRYRCATGMLTSLVFDVDHSLFGVLEAVLRLLRSFNAEPRIRVAARVDTLPPYDADHSPLGVFTAVRSFFCSFHAEPRLRCDTARVDTSLFYYVQHAILRVRAAVLWFLGPLPTEIGFFAAPRMAASLPHGVSSPFATLKEEREMVGTAVV